MRSELVYRFGEHKPAKGLSGFVSCYWEFIVESSEHQSVPHTIPPDGCINLVCVALPQPPGVVLQLNGPRVQEQTIPISVNTPVWGVRFFAGATSALLGITGRSLLESNESAFESMPEIASKIRSRIPHQPSTTDVLEAFDEALLMAVNQAAEVNNVVAAGVKALVAPRGTTSIEEIANRLNVSVRHFQRLFREEVGLTPKQFARIRRFRAAAIQSIGDDKVKWSAIANRTGYSDQAHLSREFSSLIGSSPASYDAFRKKSIRYGSMSEEN